MNPSIREEAMKAAEAEFTTYFMRNYPGPDTIIHKPEWHAPKLFYAAKRAILWALEPSSAGLPRDPTDEMVDAALAVDWQNEDERATVINIWHAMKAKLPTLQPSAARELALKEGDLNARLKAKGMYSIDEMMGSLPLDKWRVHSGMTDLNFFGEWLERKAREYLTMKAAYDVGVKDESDELYEWVLAHYGAFHDVLVNFRAALSSPDHADAAKVEGDGWMPIESAPKDGTVIDLWSAEFGRQPDCYWGKRSHCCGEDGQYCDSDWHSEPEAWIDSAENTETFDDITHWRPLPSAPASEGARS